MNILNFKKMVAVMSIVSLFQMLVDNVAAKTIYKNNPQHQKGIKSDSVQGVDVDSLFNIELKTINDKSIKLKDFGQTKLFLIVNTASKCGFTKQYEGLEALHKKFKDKGFAVIGFPSNDFLSQEPGTNDEIQEFCKLNYGVTFPLMTKGSVKGAKIQPFYKELVNLSEDKSNVGWNFEKFLVSKDGKIFKRYKSKVTPEELDSVISEYL